MICKDCENKPLARGVKQIQCMVCNGRFVTNSIYGTSICNHCSESKGICQYCGKETNFHKERVVHDSENWMVEINRDGHIAVSYFSDCHYYGEIILDTGSTKCTVVRHD